MDDLAARRRRVWLGSIMVVTVVLLAVGALWPTSASRPLDLQQAGADETLPTEPAAAIVPSTTAPVAPSSTTVTRPATTSEVVETPSTTITPPAATARLSSASIAAVAVPEPPPAPVVAPAPPPVSPSASAFLACIRQRESGGNYGAVSSSGSYRGAYQFSQSSWDATARHAGRPDLVGVPPNVASPADQDALALDLYLWQGSKPWGGACD